MFGNFSQEQKNKILRVLNIMEADGKKIYDALFDIDYLLMYLDVEDYIAFRNFLLEYIDLYPEKFESYLIFHPDNRKKYVELKKQKLDRIIQLQTSTFVEGNKNNTPYAILGLEEKEYSKEELLEKAKERIDIILDAYNELIKTSCKKR